tara:strand:- start:1980 stop:2423 length:444 start_codon:yes stop_codon:yes gene_type:complete
MTYTEKTLSKGEKILSVVKPTKWVLFWPCFFGVVLAMFGLVAAALDDSLAPTLFILSGWPLVAWASRACTEYSITDQKILKKSGIIFKKTKELSLDKAEGVNLKQSALGRVFGWGDLVISGKGSKKVEWHAVPKALLKRAEIQELIY